ncbi:MAG: hypothetical protein LBR94_02280 [Desulfovibrio sp.]|jgi:hypothetical protein|nr:hypothetical protein [Desulfovibrio sp.]
MPEAGMRAMPVWREAETEAEREEVYFFRYAHYFRRLTDAPGVDHALGRVYSPHDDRSTHLTGRGEDGGLVIVGTGTRASATGLPDIWHEILRLRHLEPLGLDRILIYSRLVEREDHRHGTVFPEFFRYSSRYFTSRGFAHTVHYCPPPMLPLYERLGYRQYGKGFSMPGGLYRIPLILVTFDHAHLGRVFPAFRQATADLHPAGDLNQVLALLPDIAETPLCALAGGERLKLARNLLSDGGPFPSAGGSDMPRRMEKALRRSSILRLEEGDSPAHREDAPLLWFVLDGLCRARLDDGSEIRAEKGVFINGGACSAFTALEPSRVVLCAAGRFDLAKRSAVLPFAFWEEFCNAGREPHALEYPAPARQGHP